MLGLSCNFSHCKIVDINTVFESTQDLCTILYTQYFKNFSPPLLKIGLFLPFYVEIVIISIDFVPYNQD